MLMSVVRIVVMRIFATAMVKMMIEEGVGLKVCEWCGTKFDPIDADYEFSMETGILSYRNIRKCLCGKCSVHAIEGMIENVYFETCEKCGSVFDLITEESSFASQLPWYNGTILRDHWSKNIQCADCAIEEIHLTGTYD